MKRNISCLFGGVFALCATAAMAEDPVVSAQDEMYGDIDALNMETPAERPESRPQKPWHRGLQFGVGVPLMAPMPLSSVGGFIGYADKTNESFWKKRFGLRLDFAFASPFTAKVYVENDDLHLNARALGFSVKQNLGAIDPITIDDNAGNTLVADIEGMKGTLSWKNQYIGGLVDFYPFGNTWFAGGLRVSGGYYFGSTNIGVSASMPNYFPTYDGYSVEVVDDIFVRGRVRGGTKASGKLHWNYRGPYAGLGFDLGVFRGFKFYTDFGVVFANAPRMRNNDIYIPERAFQACIADGTTCFDGSWVDIDVMNPTATRDGLLTQIMVGLKDHPTFGSEDYSSVTNQIPDNTLVAVANWLGSSNPAGDRPVWVDNIANLHPGSTLTEIIDKIESAAAGNNEDFNLQRITDEYLKLRADAVGDVNDGLKDFKFVPMVRLGVMYRF